jgi:hypothetical protein
MFMFENKLDIFDINTEICDIKCKSIIKFPTKRILMLHDKYVIGKMHCCEHYKMSSVSNSQLYRY